jgi:hypothetical protein
VTFLKCSDLLSNGHSPQIRENGELLVRMCQMGVSFFQKLPGQCGRVWRVLAKPLDECWLKQDRLFYAQ